MKTMNRKRVLEGLILCLIVCLCYSAAVSAQSGPTGQKDGEFNGENIPPEEIQPEDQPDDQSNDPNTGLKDFNKDYNYNDSEINGEDLLLFDQDFLSRKSLQKKLPPLKKEEKITWAFRLAETNAFL